MKMKLAYLNILLTACLLNTTFGIKTHLFVNKGYDLFAQGELENVSLNNYGVLKKAPSLTEISTIESPIVWKVVHKPTGGFYIGTGNTGIIYDLSIEGETTKIFDPEEILSRALAIDKEGNLFVGTSPNGRVYKIKQGGRPEIYFDPAETYIWDIQFDSTGNMFVATGGKGKIYKLTAEYQKNEDAILWFESTQTHLNTLAFGPNDELYAGSGPNGYLYKIPEQNKGEVLYNSGSKEISHIFPKEDGSVFFATFSSKKSKKSAPNTSDSKDSNSSTAPAVKKNETYGKIFKMEPNGFVRLFWRLPNTSIFSLTPFEDSWLVGSGDNGKIYKVKDTNDWELFQQTATGGQVTSLQNVKTADKNDLFVITSNPSRVYKLNPAEENTSSYQSSVVDAKQIANWGSLQVFNENNQDDVAISLMTRTGNVEKHDATWSEWVAVENQKIKSGKGRYLQYKIEFKANSPAIRSLNAYYHLNNIAPDIKRINVVPLGFGLIKGMPQKINMGIDKLQDKGDPMRHLDPKPGADKLMLESTRNTFTAAWKAEDPNKDDLLFKVMIKKLTSDKWITLADKHDAVIFSSSTRGLDDGYYQIKVTATDSLDNPAHLALESSRESEPFLVDTSSPTITIDNVETNTTNRTSRVQFSIIDTASNILVSAYKLNGKDALRAFPDDNLFDSKDESFTLNLTNLPSGEQSLLIEAQDTSGNRTIHQMTF